MTDEGEILENIDQLHRPVQWTGWRLFLQRAAREPRAFIPRWCLECHKQWPCPTIKSISGEKDHSL